MLIIKFFIISNNIENSHFFERLVKYTPFVTGFYGGTWKGQLIGNTNYVILMYLTNM